MIKKIILGIIIIVAVAVIAGIIFVKSKPASEYSIKIGLPKGGETLKIGDHTTFSWFANKPLPTSYVFGAEIAGEPSSFNSVPGQTAYSFNYTIPSAWMNGDTAQKITPGTYNLHVALYDGKVPVVDGMTCVQRVQAGKASSCSPEERFGNFVTDVTSNSFTITN